MSCGEILGNVEEMLGNFEIFREILENFATIYALSCGEKLSPKVHLWRKNNKYQVSNKFANKITKICIKTHIVCPTKQKIVICVFVLKIDI